MAASKKAPSLLDLACLQAINQIRLGPWPVSAPREVWGELKRRGWVRVLPDKSIALAGAGSDILAEREAIAIKQRLAQKKAAKLEAERQRGLQDKRA